MTFILSYPNSFDYLVEQGFCNQSEQALYQIEPIAAKNFNLLVSLPDNRKLLIKQERHNREGKTAGEFLSEWRIHEFLQTFPELSYLRSWIKNFFCQSYRRFMQKINLTFGYLLKT